MNQHEPSYPEPVNNVDPHPDNVVGHGRYGVEVTYSDGLARLTVRHVEHKYLPLALFGRTVLTRMVRLAHAGAFSSTLANTHAGLTWVNVVGAAPQTSVILGPEWPIDVRERVREELDAALHASGIKWGGTAIAVAAVLLLAALLGSGAPEKTGITSPAMPEPALTAEDDAAMSSANLASRAVAEKGTTMPTLEAIAQAEQIQLRPASPGKRQVILWSDPLCPNCRDFEQKVLAKLPSGVGVTIVPVAFKQGSRPLVSFATCGEGDADRAARWTDLMSAEPVGDFSRQCAAGPAAADRNSVLFARAGLVATPTLMTQDGQVFTGDVTSVADVTTWIVN